MPTSIFVLGHKNPNSDSICSAIGYAALLQAQGQTAAVAARQGGVRRETAYILERFGQPAPRLVTDVRPRVADVMTSPAITVHQDSTLYEVGQILQREGIRAVPVVDDDGRLCGVTGIEDFARSFIAGLELDQLDRMPLNLANVVRVLDGRLLVDAPGRTLQDQVMVGAMEINSMLKRLVAGHPAGDGRPQRCPARGDRVRRGRAGDHRRPPGRAGDPGPGARPAGHRHLGAPPHLYHRAPDPPEHGGAPHHAHQRRYLRAGRFRG